MIHDGDGDDGGVGQMASRSRHKRGHDDTDVIVMLPFILLYSRFRLLCQNSISNIFGNIRLHFVLMQKSTLNALGLSIFSIGYRPFI